MTIISTLTVITIPTLIKNYRHAQLEAGFKKSYAVINNAFTKISYENSEIATPDLGYNGPFRTEFMKYFKVAKDCGWNRPNLSSCGPNSESVPQTEYPLLYRTYNKNQIANYYYFDDGHFILEDGSLILIEREGAISVDINGHDKGPNLWGYDLFTFAIVNGRLIPAGAPGTPYRGEYYCSQTSTNNMNGASCTYKALTDPDYFKNLKY